MKDLKESIVTLAVCCFILGAILTATVITYPKIAEVLPIWFYIIIITGYVAIIIYQIVIINKSMKKLKPYDNILQDFK